MKIRRGHEPIDPTHSGRLERWLGADNVAVISKQFRTWPGPPVALGGVPGNVYVTGGGEFVGKIDVGDYLSHQDLMDAVLAREAKIRRIHVARGRKMLG